MTVPDPRRGLTPTRLTILGYVADGLSNAQIGTRMGVNEDAVRTQLRVVMRILGAPTRGAAAVTAIRLGLLDGAAPVPAVPTPEPGPVMLQVPAVLYDELLAVAAGVVKGRPPLAIREPARRALTAARRHVHDPRPAAGRAT